MKKVCFLADRHGLYDDRTYWKQALSLRNNGYEVHYLVIGDEDGQGITPEGIFFKLISSRRYFKNKYINWIVKKILPLTTEYDAAFIYCREIEADAYQVEDLRLNRIVHKLKNLPHKPKLIYDAREPHDNNLKDIEFGNSSLPAFLINLYARYIQNWEYKKVRLYDYLFAVDDGLFERFQLQKTGVPLKVIYNFTNLADKRKDLPVKDRQYGAAYVGGLSKVRGAMVMLQAARIVASRLPDFKLLLLGPVYGDGLAAEMNEYIASAGLSDNIILHEPVPYRDISVFYNQVKIGLNPLLDVKAHRDIIQIKLFEYMNFGIPVIASRFGYMQKYVEENEAGLTAEAGNERELADAIIRLLTDEALYEKCSRNGVKAVNELYNWGIMEKEFLGVYRGLLDKESSS
ncbi:glycosyltransferase [Terrimonas pollutisoli]|uniref:glycosyltransferase n=1 Tax=Terrimonas pollutisoli TaxID=3034147 RepID=UPI0023ED2E4B|nr:glycosyltransferase [Terrimonas sp. H1YJ31]